MIVFLVLMLSNRSVKETKGMCFQWYNFRPVAVFVGAIGRSGRLITGQQSGPQRCCSNLPCVALECVVHPHRAVPGLTTLSDLS